MDNAINAVLIALATGMFSSISPQCCYFSPCLFSAVQQCNTPTFCPAVSPRLGPGEQEVVAWGEGKAAKLYSGLNPFTCPQAECIKSGSPAWLMLPGLKTATLSGMRSF